MVYSKKNSNKNSKDVNKKNISPRRQVDGIVKRQKPESVSMLLEEKEIISSDLTTTSNNDLNSVDENKRLFMKVAGVAGLGLAASALFPKSADAYVAGSTPTSNVVGSKDASNNRINPAKEDGNLATIAGKDFATQTTLAAMKAKTDLLTFDVSNNLLTASSGGASAVGIKDSSDVRINPVQDDTVVLLRRVVKLMESQAVVDSQMRQRVVVDTGAIVVSGSVTVATITSLSQLAGVDSRWQIIDWSRQAYNSGIRAHLINA
jgi:hypothetical protein